MNEIKKVKITIAIVACIAWFTILCIVSDKVRAMRQKPVNADSHAGQIAFVYQVRFNPDEPWTTRTNWVSLVQLSNEAAATFFHYAH